MHADPINPNLFRVSAGCEDNKPEKRTRTRGDKNLGDRSKGDKNLGGAGQMRVPESGTGVRS